MNESVLGLLYLGVLLLVVKLFEDVFERIRMPPLVGAIIGGIILGKSVLNFVQANTVALFVELGVIMMLFLAGAEEFDIEAIADLRRNKRLLLATFFELGIWNAFDAFCVFIFHSDQSSESSAFLLNSFNEQRCTTRKSAQGSWHHQKLLCN